MTFILLKRAADDQSSDHWVNADYVVMVRDREPAYCEMTLSDGSRTSSVETAIQFLARLNDALAP